MIVSYSFEVSIMNETSSHDAKQFSALNWPVTLDKEPKRSLPFARRRREGSVRKVRALQANRIQLNAVGELCDSPDMVQ